MTGLTEEDENLIWALAKPKYSFAQYERYLNYRDEDYPHEDAWRLMLDESAAPPKGDFFGNLSLKIKRLADATDPA